MQEKPLKNVKVLDLSVFAAAAAAGRLLGEWGADVIKIETLGGDFGRYAGPGLSEPATADENPSFEANNAYKKGLSLNLKSIEGQKIMAELLSKSDVFLTNNRSKALERLGLDYVTIHKKYPHIIWAQITGFGVKGSEADDAGFDPVAFWAKSGAMIDAAEADTAPIVPPTGFGDRTTACSMAAGICAALYQRQITGEGTLVEVSLQGQALWNLGEEIQSVQYGDTYPKTRKNPFTPIVNSYKCRDGKWVFISCYDYERYFPLLCGIFGRQDLAADERYNKINAAKVHGYELTEILEQEFARLDRADICAELRKRDFPYSPVNQIKDMLEDGQAAANEFIIPYKHRNGKVTKCSTSPVQYLDTEKIPYVNAPLLGEHGDDILRELGYSETEIQDMIEKKCLRITKYNN